MSTSILSRLSRKQNSELRPSSRSLKFKTHRILRPADTSNLTVFDDRQISQQVNQELNLLDDLIKSYKMTNEFIESSRKKIPSIEQDVLNLEETILIKNHEINSINEDIRYLKAAKAKQSQITNKKISPIFSLASQLKKERNELAQLMDIHTQKVTNKKLLFQAIKSIEKVFSAHFPTRQIDYDMFKEKKLQILREQEVKQGSKGNKIPSYIQERVENYGNPSVECRSETNESKSLKQLQDKKRITKIAIRNARKKHLSQISQLTAKLQFLRDENALLDEKIRQTEVEKLNLQIRFDKNIQSRLRKKEKRFISQNSLF